MSFQSEPETKPAAIPRFSAVRILQNPAIAFALVLAVAALIMLRPSIHGNDGVQNYSILRSLALNGDLDFTNEYRHYMQKSPHWFDFQKLDLNRDARTGLPINLYGVGSAILWAPWFAVAHAVSWAVPGMKADGYGRLYEAAVGIGSCFYASLGLWLLFRLFASRFGALPAATGVALIWLASPLYFYMYLHPSMSHANSFFLAALLIYLYCALPGTGTWLWMGMTAGLLTITRFQDGALLLFLPVAEALRLRNHPDARRRLGAYLLFAGGFLLMLLPQLAAWNILHGRYFSGPAGYLSQGTIDLFRPVHTLQALFSSNHGLFYWHPALLAALAGLLFAGAHQKLKIACLCAFAAQLWVIGSWSVWWAGASFGHRMFISSLPFLCIGAIEFATRFRRTALVVVTLMTLWNLGCAVQYGLGLIPRDQGVAWSTLAYNNFVVLPAKLLGR